MLAGTAHLAQPAQPGLKDVHMQPSTCPVEFSVDYPDSPAGPADHVLPHLHGDPIAVVLGTVSGTGWSNNDNDGAWVAVGVAGGSRLLGPLLMILFRLKHPRWWFDLNLELQRFGNRVAAYLALMDDRYPSTDETQSVRLGYPYPDVPRELNRWLPLVKWFLAIPHYVVLFFLDIAAFFVVIVVWFAILFTGRYPRDLFGFVEGVFRWHNRVIGYAVVLVTDRYPPFRLSP
jgi:hypothetical protein